MAAAELTFLDDRLAAARAFAHTMIVVDDEASIQSKPDEDVPKEVREPGRRIAMAEGEKAADEKGYNISHPLDSAMVVDQAMDLGIVCSIVQPQKRDNVVKKVSKAAKRADIVSLDWQMNGDSGDVAKSIIKEIVRTDAQKGGRLRLIAIYTGVRDRDGIYDSVLDSLPISTKDKFNIRREGDSIVSDHGLRIVWLFKGVGIKLAGPLEQFQIREKDLPSRLQTEFSELSGGLLSNVALATIAAVRNATHHVLGKFTGRMDGPYFHHRAFLENPSDAEDYAVSIVLSELKSAVDKQEVATKSATETAIVNRMKYMGNGNADFELNYLGKDEKQEKATLAVDRATEIVTKGWRSVDKNGLPGMPGIKKVKPSLSSIFAKSYEDGRQDMMEFACLTGVRAHPGSHLHGRAPQLLLGSIIKTHEKDYLLCLQASCDTVRVREETEFYFVPMIEEIDRPDHVVPTQEGKAKVVSYMGLSLDDRAYTKSVSLKFPSSNNIGDGTVRARKIQGKRGFHFIDTSGRSHEWIATLKQRRAMRSAQWIGQDMGRIGFDEFEPFRPDPKHNK